MKSIIEDFSIEELKNPKFIDAKPCKNLDQKWKFWKNLGNFWKPFESKLPNCKFLNPIKELRRTFPFNNWLRTKF